MAGHRGTARGARLVTDDSLSPEELRTKTLRGMRWTVISRPVTELILLGSMVVLARLVSPAEFGRYAVAILVGGIGLIPAAGIGTALVHRATVTRAHLQTGFALALLSSTALFGLMLLGAGLIIAPVFGARTAELVRLSSPGCLIAAAGTVPSALVQRRLGFRQLSINDVVGTLTRAIVSIALAIAGLQGEAMVFGALAGALVAMLLMWAWAPQPPPWIHREAVRELLDYSVPSSLAALSWVGFQNVDYAIIGARVSALQSGYYFRAYTLGVEYQKKVSQVMTTVGFPVLSRTQGGQQMHALRTQMIRLLTLLLFPLLVLLSIVAPVLIPWLFGPVWTPAVVPTQILAVGGAATLVVDAVGAAFMASGRPRALLGYGWAHFAAYGLAVYAVAPLGLAAVAASAAIVHSAFMIVAYMMLLHGTEESPMGQLWRDIGPATGACAVLAAVTVPASLGLTAVQTPAVVYLGTMGLLSVAVYVLVLRVWYQDSWRSMVRFASYVLPRRRPRQRLRQPVLDGSPSGS